MDLRIQTSGPEIQDEKPIFDIVCASCDFHAAPEFFRLYKDMKITTASTFLETKSTLSLNHTFSLHRSLKQAPYVSSLITSTSFSTAGKKLYVYTVPRNHWSICRTCRWLSLVTSIHKSCLTSKVYFNIEYKMVGNFLIPYCCKPNFFIEEKRDLYHFNIFIDGFSLVVCARLFI